MSSSSSSSKNHSKRSKDIGRDRDKNKTVASESGGSSQCDTPPLVAMDYGSSQPLGKFAGVGSDSIMCMADQTGVEISPEAANNLAEDVSYKLRQAINVIALHSGMMKKCKVDCWDVNTAFNLADTGPAFGSLPNQFIQVGEEKLYTAVEEYVDVCELALNTQDNEFSSTPILTNEWIIEEKSQIHSSPISSYISVTLQSYYTLVARAILNLRKIPKQEAVHDLLSNTRIGPIFPNLFNLAVLVLNDDNLNALNVTSKKPLQSNVLDMVDALCSNPCALDTNIQQQFQRLFPVMVSNILGNGSMSEKMVYVLTKITRTWPAFIQIGRSILFEYLSHNTKDRLTGPMVKCVMALGRKALFECLNSDDNLNYLDDCLLVEKWTKQQAELRCTLLDVANVLLRSEPNTYLEDYVGCDYVLYEMLGDSIEPRRTIFPKSKRPSYVDPERMLEDEMGGPFHRSNLRKTKIRFIPTPPRERNGVHKESLFEPTRFSSDRCVRFKIKNCRTIHIPRKHQAQYVHTSHFTHVVVASGLLQRFRYKLNKPNPPPCLGAILL